MAVMHLWLRHLGLLVDHHRSVRHAIHGAGLPPDTPIGSIASEEGKVHTSVACCLDGISLALAPVLVVASGHKGGVVQQPRPVTLHVQATDVGHVVAIGLEEADEGVPAHTHNNTRLVRVAQGGMPAATPTHSALSGMLTAL